jgi:hypothetical protein
MILQALEYEKGKFMFVVGHVNVLSITIFLMCNSCEYVTVNWCSVQINVYREKIS